MADEDSTKSVRGERGWALYPGESRRVLGEVETAAVK
jgi:hypothetical protein